MLDRLKSYFESRGPGNRAGRAENLEQRHAGDLSPLDQVDRGLAGRALRYVVDGEDAGLVLDLAGRPAGGQAALRDLYKGWYERRGNEHIPTLELEAVLEFTGNVFPEENRLVALTSLHFAPTGGAEAESGYSWNAARLRLGEIPPVLLGECWNDLKSLSALGSGFDPDWRRNTEL